MTYICLSYVGDGEIDSSASSSVEISKSNKGIEDTNTDTVPEKDIDISESAEVESSTSETTEENFDDLSVETIEVGNSSEIQKRPAEELTPSTSEPPSKRAKKYKFDIIQ